MYMTVIEYNILRMYMYSGTLCIYMYSGTLRIYMYSKTVETHSVS